MEFWSSLLIVITFVTIHITLPYWSVLKGRHSHTLLSICSGTALAYVFTYLMPKLALVQTKVTLGLDEAFPVLYGHYVYLLALAGFLTFFALDQKIDHLQHSEGGPAPLKKALALQIVGYGIYSAQIGYLTTIANDPNIQSYIAASLIIGLHVVGVNHFIFHQNPAIFKSTLRWVYAGSTIVGWALGTFISSLEVPALLLNAFIAGGIIITAIRDELPGRSDKKPRVFYLSVIFGCLAILAVKHWQLS
ncbi:hypothetical protein QWI17_08180 [Gilvimarinus sp. SDUM040013]|uniref:Uncharacterized protein n=1 Tax=Gilvimarinus gilvus TaxID=3058038 RepID=A0ABU4S298_9GAMM|nr:hypothetical protein [Gilvimarinus sp. SDUM040013]MDO3385812.1 hypothetical protein [Gilvimarinus sp. SDUM040013]MDX6850626.1 hypothetical protein [Gilvimarinus sp. SDUM040013]